MELLPFFLLIINRKKRKKNDDWLWCLHCERFFQRKDLKPYNGGKQGCAFENCNGAGFNIDIFSWDAWPTHDPHLKKHWPKSVKELKKGMHGYLYP